MAPSLGTSICSMVSTRPHKDTHSHACKRTRTRTCKRIHLHTLSSNDVLNPHSGGSELYGTEPWNFNLLNGICMCSHNHTNKHACKRTHNSFNIVMYNVLNPHSGGSELSLGTSISLTVITHNAHPTHPHININQRFCLIRSVVAASSAMDVIAYTQTLHNTFKILYKKTISFPHISQPPLEL